MTATKLAGPQIWQQNLAKMIPAIYEAAVVTPSGSLFMVHGRTIEGRDGGIVAKYGDERKAQDAANVVNCLAKARGNPENN